MANHPSTTSVETERSNHQICSFRVIDSHTAGEATRTIISGGPNLEHDETTPNPMNAYQGQSSNRTHAFNDPHSMTASGEFGWLGSSGFSVDQRLQTMRSHHDHFRRALVHEPRGSDVMVGALLVPPMDPKHLAGVIFFNNVGYLGMCGHGTIGVVETLRYLGAIQPGVATLETSVGNVVIELHTDQRVTVENVISYRDVASFPVAIDGYPPLVADIAYGGNWFCLIACPDPSWLDRSPLELIALTQCILQNVRRTYPLVDHVELFAPAKDPANDSRSFVLCPGGAYDRSPCGTGTSAKLACLAADGKLEPNALWHQESYIGSVFEGRYAWVDSKNGRIVPRITARAFVNADTQLLVHREDPFGWGFQ